MAREKWTKGMKDGRDQNIDLGKGGGIPWCEREGSWETLPSLLNNGLCAMVRETGAR
jgi:hypothetical protein